jgi:carboxypeptidase Q
MRRSPARSWSAIALLTTTAAVAFAESPTPPEPAAVALDHKLIAQANDGSEVLANLTYLSDVIGPRLTGSDNLKRANDWAAEKMKSYGLSNVHLEPWTIPNGWQRGTATARLIEPDNGRSLTVAALGWTPGTNGPVEAEIIPFTAKAKDELPQYRGRLKGAVILYGAPETVRPITEAAQPRTDRPDRRRGGSDAERMRMFEQQREFRRELREFLRAEGVAVTLMDAGKPHGLLNMGGGWPDTDRTPDRVSAREPLPSLFVTHDHYTMLWRLATRPAPARTRVVVDVTNTFVPGPLTVYNTVGELPGSEKPDEFVVVGAHLDSWDLGQGTTDNGTGTCVVLETARVLAKGGVRPKRTIRFVLFTGEEQGLYGSKAFVKAHKDEMARTSLAIVHDTGTGRVTAVGTQGRESLKGVFEKELASLKDVGVAEVTTRRSFGSDHQSFDAAGVPGIMFTQDPAEYRFTHHSQSDTLDKAKEPDLVQGAQVMAVMAVRVANLPGLLPRDAPPTGRERRGSQ